MQRVIATSSTSRSDVGRAAFDRPCQADFERLSQVREALEPWRPDARKPLRREPNLSRLGVVVGGTAGFIVRIGFSNGVRS